MARPNFSGVYSLKSSENEDNFLKAQGIGWVLRKAAKAVGAKRVLIEHEGETLKIKAGLLDLEYEIGGEPLPTSFMGFEFTDGCDWHSDGVSLCQTKLYKDGSKVTTVRTLSTDQQTLTYANCWVDKDSKHEVRSTQILQRVGELLQATSAGACEDESRVKPDGPGVGRSGAQGVLNSLDKFVTGYDTPSSGYATPPEEFAEEQFSDADLVQQLTRTRAGLEAYSAGDTAANFPDEDDTSSASTGDVDSSLEAQAEVKLKWMWADAGFSFSAKLAMVNPLRWSSAMAPGDLKINILKQSKSRPVLITILGQKQKIRFPDAASAAAWIDETTSELHSAEASSDSVDATPHRAECQQGGGGSGTPGGAGGGRKSSEALMAVWRFVAPAYCVYFMRRYAQTSWRKKNIFVASACARRISQLPHQVSGMQEAASGEGAHPRKDASFQDLAAAGVEEYKALMEAASPFAFPQGEESTCECVVTFRGCDGSVVDSCHHPASPVRAFIHGGCETDLPELPLELLRSLAERVTEVRSSGGSGSITLVGFSHGGLMALACALWLGGGGGPSCCSDLDPLTLDAAHLFNCATMFWPPWLSKLLSDDWWTNAPAVSSKITSWVISHDPLSDVVPGTRGLRAPQTPGTTLVLPCKFADKDLIKNHALSNFAE